MLVLSIIEDRECIAACLEAGARDYISKTLALRGLPAAMQTVASGGRYVPA